MLTNGFELIPDFLSDAEIAVLSDDLKALQLGEQRGGIRNIEKKSQAVADLCKANKVLQLAAAYLPGKPVLVRAIFFNKTARQNWLVTWHQDKTVAVSKQFTESGWEPWSTKDSTLHVQPPVEVLEQMVTLRIHLDKADASNGCLKVIPGSHKAGLMVQEELSRYVNEKASVLCEAGRGDALIMRPHLLHASGKAKSPEQRRIIHLEFSSYKLPEGVDWAAGA